jgi:predicted  nucleic acid-binding Zn-ribbon protein
LSLEPLLALQDHDTAIDRLRHRWETLAQRAALEQVETDLAAQRQLLATSAGARDEVRREEQRLDDDAQSTESKAVEVERRLYSGEISSPRELQTMQSDVVQLRRHRSNLEDRELAVMEKREVLDSEVAQLEQTIATLDARQAELRAALAAEEAEIGDQLALEQAARGEVAKGLSAELLAEYERCRAHARGVGVARLVGNTCQGCHLSIPATEVDRMRKMADGAISHCDNCGCILVA